MSAVSSPSCSKCGEPCASCVRASFAEEKVAFHKKYLAVFKALAKLLGLPKGSYDLSSNKAGPVVMGEVTFHTNYAYAMVSGYLLQEGSFLLRAVRDRKDYTGFENAYYPLSHLEGDMKSALKTFRNYAAYAHSPKDNP